MYYRQFQGRSYQPELKLHYLLHNSKHTTRKGNISTLSPCICKVIMKSNYWPYNVCPHAIARLPPNGFHGSSYVVLLQFLDTLWLWLKPVKITLYMGPMYIYDSLPSLVSMTDRLCSLLGTRWGQRNSPHLKHNWAGTTVIQLPQHTLCVVRNTKRQIQITQHFSVLHEFKS